MVAVVSDCGIQLHLARAVARRPEQARAAPARVAARPRLDGRRRRRRSSRLGLAVGWRGPSAAPIAILVASSTPAAGSIELLHYFYRGLSRSDVESSLTLWQRGGTLVCGLIALALEA